MIKNVNNLIRLDFTNECRTCKFRKQFNEFEYCCSFVFEQLEAIYSYYMKKQVLNYIFFDDDLAKLNASNIFFNNDDEYCVTVTFKTNLKGDKYLILNEIKKALLDNPHFRKIGFIKDSLSVNRIEKI